MKKQWCWRCRIDVLMLDENEFARVTSHASKMDRCKAMLDEYNRITGFDETNWNAVWHHRLSIYGRPCQRCGKVLRTPAASKCFECGHVQTASIVRRPSETNDA